MYTKMLLKLMHSYLVLFSLVLLFSTESLYCQSGIWVGSWSCAPYAAGPGNTPPSPYIANNTLRQVVRVSIGGDTLRVKFSNKTCTSPVTMNSVNIAVSTGESSIDISTIKPLKFNGDTSVTMDAFSSITSDPVAFPLTPSMRVAITIYYGQAASTIDMTSHVASRTDSYILTGDQSSSADFSGAVITAHWYHINTIDVRAPDTAGCVGVHGNSITDGYGLSGGLQNRWTDFFSQALLSDSNTQHVGVLNLGIGATNVAGSGATTGANRFQQDILSQSGLRWVIIFYGTNDIAGGASATTITSAYQKMIDDAHAMNIKVYGGTITPFKGSGYYSEAHEAIRNEVNEWIRTPGNFDACIDFDKTMRDPNDTSRLMAEYSNDWLHPNVAGYQVLGESININLFTEITDNSLPIANAGANQTLVDYGNKGSRSVKLDGSGSSDFGSTIASYVWSEGANQIATGENPSVILTAGTHTITLTVTDNDGNTDTNEVIITVIEDSGVWLEAECGTVGSLWNVETDDNASNSYFVTIKPNNNSTNDAPLDAPGHLTYTFNVSESGSYTLYTRVICPSPSDDSFWLKMDDGSFVMWNNIATSSSWTWTNYTSAYNLSKGNHTLTIGYREDGAKLDKLWITRNNADLLDEGSVAGSCSVSAADYEITGDIKIYPNPVCEKLNIILQDSPAIVSLCNSIGSERFNQYSQTTNMIINMANYISGIYFVKITGQHQTIVKKIMKE